MKLKRTKKEFGGGSGKGIFESDLFRVVVWYLSKGAKTTINCNLDPWLEISFEGKHEFKSDNECIAQFNAKEILKIIKYQKEVSFEEGERSKSEEIRSALYLR